MSAVRILGCFKVTPDYEALRDADWVAGPGDAVRSRYVRRVLNCFDESALELALRLRDALAERDVAAGLGALSVGGRETEPFFATLYALGYERAARIEPGAALDYVPAATAALLAGYARRVDRSDLLLLGSRCGPGDSGTVPFLVAEELGWPCVTQVTEVAPAGDGDGLRVTCAADDGRLTLTVHPPCVLAIGNALVSHLRVPTLTDRLARRESRADILAPRDVGVDLAEVLGDAPGALEGLERIDRSRAGVVVGGGTPAELARALFAARVEEAIARS
jgi:electron transfer flavoprotein alpha/beta subunit